MSDKLEELKSSQSSLCYSYLNRLDHKSIFHVTPTQWKGYSENESGSLTLFMTQKENRTYHTTGASTSVFLSAFIFSRPAPF